MADDDARARRTTKATTGATGATSKKATAKKAPAKKAPAVKKAQPVKKVPAVKKAGRGTRGGAVLAPRAKKAPAMRLAAEQTFDDDWQEPEPEPVREDPHARVRALLRAAALEVEGRTPPATVSVPKAAPPPPRDEPVTRVLVAPVPEDDEELDVEDEVVEEDWSPPEILEEDAPPPPPPPRNYTPPAPPPPRPPTPPEAPTTEIAPPPAPPSPATTFEPRPQPAEEKKGAGLSILAIVLAIVVPVVGAIIGLVLSGRARRRGASLSGVARVVSILALVAWLVGGGVTAYAALRDEGIDYSELKVGDCFDSSASNEIRGVNVEDCAEPHNSEIFFVVTHPAGPEEPYPGKDALVQFAADACLGQPLTDYLGVPLEQSSLKDFEIVPQESAWEDGRRVLVCGLDTGGQGDVTGSVKGTGR